MTTGRLARADVARRRGTRALDPCQGGVRESGSRGSPRSHRATQREAELGRNSAICPSPG